MNIVDMSNQEIFDEVVKGLESQSWIASIGENGYCQFRGLGGRKCAIGWLIPDDDYNKAFENLNGDIERLLKKLEQSYTIELLEFLWELRDLHDDLPNPEAMREGYRKFAKSHDLTWPES